MQKFFFYFDIETDHLISAKLPYLMIAKKKKKDMEHESDGDNNYNFCARYSH